MAEDAPVYMSNGDSLHQESSFVNPRQYTIFTQSWIPAEVRATIVLVHGLGEYSDRYSSFVEHFTGLNIAVFALDHEAHGRSGGAREYVEKVQHLVDDVVTYAQSVHTKYPDVPHIVFGHSMGGCITMTICRQHPTMFDYAMISAPVTTRPTTVNPMLRALGNVVSLVGPKMRLTPLDTTTLCRDEEVVKAYKADPLVWHSNMAVGFGCDILDAGDKTIETMSQFHTPYLLMVGTADTTINPEGSYKFFLGSASTDKTLISLKGWYHELLNEPEGKQLLPVMSHWLLERLALAKGATLATHINKIGTVNAEGILQLTHQ